jgi:hypothetical protein
MGATLALCIIASAEVYKREGGSWDYPDPPERLLHFLDKFVPESKKRIAPITDAAWSLAVFVMQLHLVNSGKAIDRPSGFDGYRDFLSAAVGVLGDS